MKKAILYFVIPCFNEEENILETTERLKIKLDSLIESKTISSRSKILFVNDGSCDNTWNIIKDLSENDKTVTGISLAKNAGHQNALVAGLLTAKKYADVVISMDADLQDDINAVDEMLEKFYDGCDIVYGVRSNRKKDSFFKKCTAQLFYKFLKFMGVDIVYNHADFRLTSKSALDRFGDFKEVNLFLRGIFPLIGAKTDVVYYKREKRFAGKSKYPLRKMINFALDGITSFSIKPIRLVLSLGVFIFVVSLIIMIYCLVVKLLGHTVTGWTFLAISIWLVAGVQMLSLGIIGEYIGKIYKETKARPRYIISEDLTENKNIFKY